MCSGCWGCGGRGYAGVDGLWIWIAEYWSLYVEFMLAGRFVV